MFPDNSLLSYIMQSRPATANTLGNMMGLTPQAHINQGFGTLPPTQVSGTAQSMPFGPNASHGYFNPPQNAASPMTNFNQSFGDLTPQGLNAYGQAQQQWRQQQAAAQQQQAPPAPGAPMSLAPQTPGPSATPSPFSDDFLGRLGQMGSRQGSGLVPRFANLLGIGRRTGPDSPAGYGGPSSPTGYNGGLGGDMY